MSLRIIDSFSSIIFFQLPTHENEANPASGAAQSHGGAWHSGHLRIWPPYYRPPRRHHRQRLPLLRESQYRFAPRPRPLPQPSHIRTLFIFRYNLPINCFSLYWFIFLLQRVTRPKGGIDDWLQWLPLSLHQKFHYLFSLFRAFSSKSQYLPITSHPNGLSSILEADANHVVNLVRETYEKWISIPLFFTVIWCVGHNTVIDILLFLQGGTVIGGCIWKRHDFYCEFHKAFSCWPCFCCSGLLSRFMLWMILFMWYTVKSGGGVFVQISNVIEFILMCLLGCLSLALVCWK